MKSNNARLVTRDMVSRPANARNALKIAKSVMLLANAQRRVVLPIITTEREVTYCKAGFLHFIMIILVSSSVLQCNWKKGLSSAGRCVPCTGKSCTSCDGYKPTECLECESNHSLNKAKQCVACPANCENCNGDTPPKCIACKNGYPSSYGVTPTGSCAPCFVDFCEICDGNQKICKECQVTYTYDAAKNKCLKCADTCLACKPNNLAFCTKVSLKFFSFLHSRIPGN